MLPIMVLMINESLKFDPFRFSSVFTKPLCLNLGNEHTAKLIGKPNQYDDTHGPLNRTNSARNGPDWCSAPPAESVPSMMPPNKTMPQGLRKRKHWAALVVPTETLKTAPLTVATLVKGLQRPPASRLRALSSMKPE